MFLQFQLNVIINRTQKEVYCIMRMRNTKFCFLRIGCRPTDKCHTRPDKTRPDEKIPCLTRPEQIRTDQTETDTNTDKRETVENISQHSPLQAVARVRLVSHFDQCGHVLECTS